MDEAMRDYLLSFDPVNEKTLSKSLDDLARASRHRALQFRAEHGEPTDVMDQLWKDIPDDIWNSVIAERFGDQEGE